MRAESPRCRQDFLQNLRHFSPGCGRSVTVGGRVLGVEAETGLDQFVASLRPGWPEFSEFLFKPILEDNAAVGDLGSGPVLLQFTEVPQKVSVLPLLVPLDRKNVGFLLAVSSHPVSRTLVAVEDDQAGNPEERQDGTGQQQDV